MAALLESLSFFFLLVGMLDHCTASVACPAAQKYGPGPPASCPSFTDPNKRPPTKLETWFTRDMFNDLFPKANIGWGPNKCSPYNYDTFILAARYFPQFGTEAPANGYTAEQNYRRDLSAFFAHAVQETGENDASLYTGRPLDEAHACFYRGGFYNWFEGGPVSSFLDPASPGYKPQDGDLCVEAGRYCASSAELDYFFPCYDGKVGSYRQGCYFGRGAIQLSYNFNYGQFQHWLREQNVTADLLKSPNLLLTKTDPPLTMMGSLWFYMTPQPPKPAMHDIVLGQWEPGPKNRDAGYKGPIFGPTSLIINNECNGEDEGEPGGPGESRRIKAFRWFNKYFGVPTEERKLLSCKGMPEAFDVMQGKKSWQPDWSMTWKEEKCRCAPATYGGMIPYYEPGQYPERFVAENVKNQQRCVDSIYAKPAMYGMNPESSVCLKTPK